MFVVFSLFLAIVSKTYAVEHVAQKGENLATIMRLYGVEPVWGPGKSVEAVLDVNDEMLRQFPDSVEVGQVIVIPDSLIDSFGATDSDVGIRTKNGEVIQVTELSAAEKKEVQKKEADIDKTLQALDESIDEALGPVSQKEDSKGTVPATTPVNNTPKDEESPTEAPAQIEQTDKHKVLHATFSVTPQVTQLHVKTQVAGERVDLNGQDGSGIGFELEGTLLNQFSAGLRYRYHEISLEKPKTLSLNQQARSHQLIDLLVGWKPVSFLTTSIITSLSQNFAIYDVGSEIVVRNSWSPLMGVELDFADTFNKGQSQWSVSLGVQHLPRQQVGAAIRKEGRKAYAEAAILTRMYYHSFLEIGLGYSLLSQDISGVLQTNQETTAILRIGTEL